jgi:hypothetical protein
MKTKLLRKIRKRFGYYFNKNGWPVLVDHKREVVFVIGVDEILRTTNCKTIEDYKLKNEAPMELYAWRLLKMKIGQPFEVDLLQRVMYRRAKKYAAQPEKHRIIKN